MFFGILVKIQEPWGITEHPSLGRKCLPDVLIWCFVAIASRVVNIGLGEAKQLNITCPMPTSAMPWFAQHSDLQQRLRVPGHCVASLLTFKHSLTTFIANVLHLMVQFFPHPHPVPSHVIPFSGVIQHRHARK